MFNGEAIHSSRSFVYYGVVIGCQWERCGCVLSSGFAAGLGARRKEAQWMVSASIVVAPSWRC
jgi:hypothetical protein